MDNYYVANADDHPTSLMESDISHGEMLGILYTTTTKYRKREHDANNTDLMNKQLADEREAACGQEAEKPIKPDTVELASTHHFNPRYAKCYVNKKHFGLES